MIPCTIHIEIFGRNCIDEIRKYVPALLSVLTLFHLNIFPEDCSFMIGHIVTTYDKTDGILMLETNVKEKLSIIYARYLSLKIDMDDIIVVINTENKAFEDVTNYLLTSGRFSI